MKTYWDLSEQERAALTGADVERFGDAELMIKGVLKVDAPKLEPVPAMPEPDVDVFAVSAGYGKADVAFADAESARAFVALKPMVRSSMWTGNESIQYVDTAGTEEWKISAERAHSKQLAELRKNEFVASKDVKARNERLTTEYEAALKAQQGALADMWSDWRECGVKASRMQKVAETFAMYERTADGDKNIAFRFLRKVFTNEEIIEATEWGLISIPDGFLRMGMTDRIDDLAETTHAEAPARQQPEASAELF